jgi:hypothetical protein
MVSYSSRNPSTPKVQRTGDQRETINILGLRARYAVRSHGRPKTLLYTLRAPYTALHAHAGPHYSFCHLDVTPKIFNPFPATFQKIGTSARLSRDRLPCDSPIEADHAILTRHLHSTTRTYPGRHVRAHGCVATSL